MANKRPVLCPACGGQIMKNGYCSACYMPTYVIKKAHNTSNYHYNIGYNKAVARDLTGAIDSLNTSLRYNKRNIMTRNLLGLIYYEMGEVVTALSHWVMSVNYRQNNNVAATYLKELRQDPTKLDSVDQMARKYNMALTYSENGDLDLAIIQLKSILKENPHFVKGYLLLALLYIEINHYEDARKTLRRVLKIDKANPTAVRYLQSMGDSDENIVQMRMQPVENDGLFDDEQGRDISISVDGKTIEGGKLSSRVNVINTGELGEINFVKYSGLYVLIGFVLSVLILSFIIVPHERKKAKNESEELIKSYSEELASKNSKIEALNSEVRSLYNQIEELTKTEDDGDNPMPDYSQVEHGMSIDDIQDMIDNE